MKAHSGMNCLLMGHTVDFLGKSFQMMDPSKGFHKVRSELVHTVAGLEVVLEVALALDLHIECSSKDHCRGL